MNPHERYQAFMRFQAVDRPPLLEWSPWESTVRAWMAETGKDREFMVPRYKRITGAIRSAGHDIIMLDSDGDVRELIPLWLESGINGVFPMEQAAGNDVHFYRKEYGRDLLMSGGVDKRTLTQGERAIDEELGKKVALAFEGGYVPTVDHSIPPDVSFRSFMYYWNRKKERLGV